MKVLVTGSAGHLGEALMRCLPDMGHVPVGLDIRASRFTDHVGTLVDCEFVARVVAGTGAILHTATLHKPHVATHSKQDFVDSNITGTLNLLQAARAQGIKRFTLTSTTSAFGGALNPKKGAPAAWITEAVTGLPRNIYGVTKTAAEDICALFGRKHGVDCTVLRTSRFFPEPDDNRDIRSGFIDQNAKANEFLFRRVDLQDVVTAHERTLHTSPVGGFARYIISATSPFRQEHLADLRRDPAAVVRAIYPDFADIYGAAGYRLFDDIDRVYVNDLARNQLGWKPEYDFARVLGQIADGQPIGSELARRVGIKGYHSEVFKDGPYPVD